MSHGRWGSVRQLPSNRYQASYLGPDKRRYSAPVTFDTKDTAEGWLAIQRAAILERRWNPAGTESVSVKEAPLTLREYAATWLDGRDLSPSTRRLYTITLGRQILPALGSKPLGGITPVMVRSWHAKLDTGPRQRAHAYSLLRTIMNTAVADDIIVANPCRVRGAGQSARQRPIRPASVPELEAIAAAMPKRYQLMVLLAAWCALRFGELSELRRADIELSEMPVRNTPRGGENLTPKSDGGVIHVRRGVVQAAGGRVVKDPKSAAGRRDVHIPPHLIPAVKDHLSDHVPAGPNALLFPGERGGHLAHSHLYRFYYPAREKAGRPDLRFHDLRHTGAVLAAATGATLAELMARLGHSTVSAAMRYQHAAADRDKAIAEALSKMATVTPISAAKRRSRSA